VKKGEATVQKTGPKGKLSEEAYDAIKKAFFSYLAIAQINGDAEKKINSDILPLLEDAIHGTKKHGLDTRCMLRRLLRDCAEELQTSKEIVQELRRQFWTTYSNLDRWFNAWEETLLTLGFATKDNNGQLQISEEQKKRIVNMDETKLSLDGSDGQFGGRPALTISVRGVNRPGTAQNKSGFSSTLMCGSNSAGEPLPLHIMFSSKAENEENFQVRADWLVELPSVTVQFGRSLPEKIDPTLTVNSKGGSDSRVLYQVLMGYAKRLYPDCADVDGKRVIFKIDGGPGRLDLKMLSDLRA
jgi:hypothetical protein